MTNEANKQTAQAFYDLMFNQCQPREAIERYAGGSYIQHNPVVPDGKDGFIAYFERMAAEYPGKRVHIVRALAEADFVVLHTRQEWPAIATGLGWTSSASSPARLSSTGTFSSGSLSNRRTATRCSKVHWGTAAYGSKAARRLYVRSRRISCADGASFRMWSPLGRVRFQAKSGRGSYAAKVADDPKQT